MIYGIFASMLASIIFTGRALQKQQQQINDLKAELERVREHVGMNNDLMESAKQLIKSNQVDQAIQLIQMSQAKKPRLI